MFHLGLLCLSQKATEIAVAKAKKDHSRATSHNLNEDKLMSDHEFEERVGGGPSVSEEPESAEGVNSQAEDDHIQQKEVYVEQSLGNDL